MTWSFGKIKERIWSLGSSVKQTAKVLAVSGMLATTLSACSDNDNGIKVDPEKQEVSFSIKYFWHKSGNQDFLSDIIIKKKNDSTFVVEVSDPTLVGAEESIFHEGTDVKWLIKQAVEDIENRVPMNTREGHDAFVAKVRKKCNSAAEQYEKMLGSENK